MSIEAISYWETSSILVSLKGSPLTLYDAPTNFTRHIHGEVKDGSTMITLDEAKHLLKTLTSAIEQYEHMEKCVEEDFGPKE